MMTQRMRLRNDAKLCQVKLQARRPGFPYSLTSDTNTTCSQLVFHPTDEMQSKARQS